MGGSGSSDSSPPILSLCRSLHSKVFCLTNRIHPPQLTNLGNRSLCTQALLVGKPYVPLLVFARETLIWCSSHNHNYPQTLLLVNLPFSWCPTLNILG